jgi:hypothetical protein
VAWSTVWIDSSGRPPLQFNVDDSMGMLVVAWSRPLCRVRSSPFDTTKQTHPTDATEYDHMEDGSAAPRPRLESSCFEWGFGDR